MAYRKNFLVVISIFVINIARVIGYSNTDVVRLRETILGNYNPNIRPVVNQDKPLTVGLLLSMTNLIQIDMLNGQLEAVGYLGGTWRDELLAWNGTEFDDIPKLALQQGDIWTPDITQFDAIAEEVEKVSIVVEKDGTVVWIVFRRYTTFCILDMRYYPLDDHVCNFKFTSAQYTEDELLLVPSTDEVVLSMRDHGEWTVSGSSVSTMTMEALGYHVQAVVFTINFARMPEFILLHKAAPLFLLLISNIFVHVVPLISGEKISYSVTVLLAFVFWQALVTEDLPQNSSKISLLSFIMTICIGSSTLSTILSVIFCRLIEIQDRPVPRYIAKLAACFRYGANSRKSKHAVAERVQATNENGCINDEENDVEKKEDSVNVDNEVTWLEAANALDRLALTLMVVLTLLTLIGFILGYVIR